MKRLINNKIQARARRHCRVRARIKGTAEKPRLSIYRGLENVMAQLIDDEKSKTILGVNSRALKVSLDNPHKGKMAKAYETGLAVAKAALEKGIKQVCFDRGGYLYHGRVKAAADGARAGGLIF